MRTAVGVAAASVGRMHSCASCAFLALFLYMRGDSGTYSLPYSPAMNSRVAITASGAMSMPSVRM